MSLWVLEGFDDGLHLLRPRLRNFILDTANEAHGYASARLGDNHGAYIYYGGGDDDEIIVGFNAYISDGSPGRIVSFYGGGAANAIGGFAYDQTNERFAAYSGDFATLIGSGTIGEMPRFEYHYVEFRYKVSDTVGEVEVRIDDVEHLKFTTQDTKPGSDTTIDDVRILGSGANDMDDWRCDDLYILDTSGSAPTNDFLGPIEVRALYPSGNGNNSGLTGSDGNSTDNYLLVDENPNPNTTDYAGSDTEGDYDLYAMGNLDHQDYDIMGVSVSAYAAKSDAGTAKYGRTKLRTNSTDYNGSSVLMSELTWKNVQTIYDLNPNTSSQWTAVQVDAVEAGFEVRDS